MILINHIKPALSMSNVHKSHKGIFNQMTEVVSNTIKRSTE